MALPLGCFIFGDTLFYVLNSICFKRFIKIGQSINITSCE